MYVHLLFQDICFISCHIPRYTAYILEYGKIYAVYLGISDSLEDHLLIILPYSKVYSVYLGIWQDIRCISCKFCQLMPNLCPTYVQLMPNLCPTYAKFMPNVCPTYAKVMRNVCQIYAKLMSNLCQKLWPPFKLFGGDISK